MLFEKNKLYRRSELHDQYGGNRQRGISTSAKHNVIFIFDMNEGSFGYRNHWDEEQGLYYYSGEGQIGDQSFTQGNKALLKHIEYGKSVYLFKEVGNSLYRFVDQMLLIGYDIQFGSDKNLQQREVIVFAFEPIHAIREGAHKFSPTMRNKSVEELKQIATRVLTQATGLSLSARQFQVREQSSAVHYSVLARANDHCEACNQPAPFESEDGPYLELHSLYNESDDVLLNPSQAAAVCPNCHARLHKGKDRMDFNERLKNIIISKVVHSLDQP